MARKIMIVDDDTIFLEELKETLVLNKYDVIAVTDAMEIVNQVKKPTQY
jgi:DNA-binding NtrC family response regulator